MLYLDIEDYQIAELFTDIDQLKIGDTFMLQILDQTLYYEVDQIKTVLPTEKDDLKIVEGQDYCTLMTCTPYGVNTHVTTCQRSSY